MWSSGLWISTPAGGAMSAAVTAQVHHHRLVLLAGEHQLLEVQDDLGDVLDDALHRGELVLVPLDLDAGDGRARDGRQQRAPQRVAEGVAEAGLQGLDDEPGAELVHDLFGQDRTLCDEHGSSSPPPTI
jgi:hypothetical protein